ncbi:MAG TPA: hypothetical protein VFV93_04635 [Thermomicrobiales bacterium]|nr:hypothetical protein [Thermomicrobiales bacterium]
MATDASSVLAAPQIAGTFVNPKGFARQVTATVAGGVVGSAIASASGPGQGDVPSFGRVAFVAATSSEVAIIKTKSGMLKMKLTDQVLARRARADINAIELKRGALLSGLMIQFNDGGTWSFDVPKANQKSAVHFVEQLGGVVR